MRKFILGILLLVSTVVGAQTPPAVWDWINKPGHPNSLWTESPATATFSDLWAPLTSSAVLSTGPGALNFARNSVTTVVDHDGGIRNVIAGEIRFAGARRVQNVVSGSSEDLTNAAWVKVNVTAANVGDIINGLPATRLTLTGGLSLHNVNQLARFVTGASSLWQSYSVDVTGMATKLVAIEFTNPTERVIFQWSGPQTITIAGATAGMEYGWKIHGDYQATVYAKSFAARTAASAVSFYAGAFGNYDGDGQYFAVTRASGNDLSGAFNQNPPEYVSVGTAKLNELTFSSEFDNAAWVKAFATVTANAAVGPFGATSADKLVEDNTNNWHGFTQNGPLVDGLTITTYFYLKAGERTWARVRIGAGAWAQSWYDLSTGTLGSQNAGGGNTLIARSIEDMGNGWYRCSITALSSVAGNGARVYTATADAVEGYLGDGTSGIYVDAAQLRRGSEPAVYFPVSNPYAFNGAAVDGVRYFEWENGNTIQNNVVVEAQGRPITLTRNQFGRLPGTSGSYYSTPDPSIRLTNDQDIRAYVCPDDSTPTALQILVSKWDSTVPSLQTIFYLDPAGTLTYIWSSTGLVLNTIATSTAAIAPAVGQCIQLRVTHDINNGAGGNDVKFWTSTAANDSNWVQLGNTITNAGATTIADTNRAVWVGAHDTAASNTFTGMVRRVQMYDGIGGTLVVDFDVNDWASGATFVSSVGGIWTLNGGAVINNYVLKGFYSEAASSYALISPDSSVFAAGWIDGGTPTRVANPVRVGDWRLDEIGDDDAGAAEHKRRGINFVADLEKVCSVLWKVGTSTSSAVRLRDTTAAANRFLAIVVPANGAPVVTATTGSEERPPEPLGGGVYRLFFKTTSLIAANTNVLEIYPAADAALAVANTGTVNIGGVQCENGLISSSLSVTARSADRLKYLGVNLPTQGVLYSEYQRPTAAHPLSGFGNPRSVALTDGVASSEKVEIIQNSSTVPTQALFFVTDGGVPLAGPVVNNFVANTIMKGAGRFMTNDTNIASNGVLGSADGAVTMPTTTQMEVGVTNDGLAGWLYGTTRNVRMWNGPYADSFIQAITQ